MPVRQSKESNMSKYKEKRLLLDRGEDGGKDKNRGNKNSPKTI